MASLPEPVPTVPFTTREALAAGMSRTALDGPGVRRLFAGVYLPATGPVTVATLTAAARRVLPPDALVTGPSALRLAGVDVGPLYPLRFVTAHPHQVRRRGLRVTRVQTLPPATAGVVPPAYAWCASGTALDLVELVVAGDHLVRAGHCSAGDLRSAAAAWGGRGAVVLRRAAGLVRPRVDSPRESELRLCLVLAGLPEPACNLVLGEGRVPIGGAMTALRQRTGKNVAVTAERDISHFDEGAIHLLTTSALSLVTELHGEPLNTRRFRNNITLETGSDAKHLESEWVGRQLAIGDTLVLEIAYLMPRCVMVNMPQHDLPEDARVLKTIARINPDVRLGAFARVLQPGAIKLGDTARLI